MDIIYSKKEKITYHSLNSKERTNENFSLGNRKNK